MLLQNSHLKIVAFIGTPNAPLKIFGKNRCHRTDNSEILKANILLIFFTLNSFFLKKEREKRRDFFPKIYGKTLNRFFTIKFIQGLENIYRIAA